MNTVRLSLVFQILTVFVLLPLLMAVLGFLIVQIWVADLWLALLAGLVTGGWALCFLDCYVMHPRIRNV